MDVEISKCYFTSDASIYLFIYLCMYLFMAYLMNLSVLYRMTHRRPQISIYVSCNNVWM
jgi:hypothetical protein